MEVDFEMSGPMARGAGLKARKVFDPELIRYIHQAVEARFHRRPVMT
jgi:hypothetical protein